MIGKQRIVVSLVTALVLLSCERGPTEPTPDGTKFVFRNQGTVPIVEAGASTCDDLSEWPNNLKSPLAPGAETTINVYKECWDLHAKFQDGREKIQWAVEMAKGASYTWLIN